MIPLLLALLGCADPSGDVTAEDPGFLCRSPTESPVDTGLAAVSLSLVASHEACRPLVSLTCDLELVRGDIVASGTLVEGPVEPACVPSTDVDVQAPCTPDIPDAATRIIVYGEVATEVVLLPACIE